MPSATPLPVGSLLQLIWLASPALPVGGFSYSEGLEAGVDRAGVATESIASDWLCDQLQLSLARGDLAVIAQAIPAWRNGNLEKIKALPGITDVTTDQESTGPLLDITVNREVASSFGILPATIDNTLEDAFGQRIVSTMYTMNNEYHVVLEVEPKFQFGPEALSNIYVNSSTGQQVPLRTLVNTAVKVAPLVVNHQGQFPSVTISFNLMPGVSIGTVELRAQRTR